MRFPSASCLIAVLSRRILWKSSRSRFHLLYVSVLSCLRSQTSPFGHSVYCEHLSGLTPFYYAPSLLQILFITDTSLIRAPLHYGKSITDTFPFWTPLYYGHLSSANTLYYRHPSSMDMSLLRTFSITDTCLRWKPLCYGLFHGILFITDTFLLQTPINCRHLLWTCLYYGHLSVSTASTH